MIKKVPRDRGADLFKFLEGEESPLSLSKDEEVEIEIIIIDDSFIAELLMERLREELIDLNKFSDK